MRIFFKKGKRKLLYFYDFLTIFYKFIENRCRLFDISCTFAKKYK